MGTFDTPRFIPLQLTAMKNSGTELKIMKLKYGTHLESQLSVSFSVELSRLSMSTSCTKAKPKSLLVHF
jgi:hypothetical protein